VRGDLDGDSESESTKRKSQRDFIIQPSVDAMKSRLRWVVNRK
jgi:hypothetical protein